MVYSDLKSILTKTLGHERGELHFAFLLAQTIISNDKPTLENTRLLTAKDDEFKTTYLQEHFRRTEQVIKVISTIIESHDKTLINSYLRQYSQLTGKTFSIWTHSTHRDSPFSHPERFGEEDFPLWIVDPFRGGEFNLQVHHEP